MVKIKEINTKTFTISLEQLDDDYYQIFFSNTQGGEEQTGKMTQLDSALKLFDAIALNLEGH